MSFVAQVEYEVGEIGTTAALAKERSFDILLTYYAARSGGNIDQLAFTLAKDCRENRRPHSSIVLKQLGVPLTPAEADDLMVAATRAERFYGACAKAFGYTKPWSNATPRQERAYDLAAEAFVESDPQLAAAADLLDAAKAAQRVLAMLTEPKSIQSTTVMHAWEQAVAAEVKVRAAIDRAEGRAR